MDFNKIMEQAQKLKDDFQSKQEEIAKKEFTGSAGAGAVTVTITGKGKISNIEIEDSFFASNDKEMLQDLIKAAYNAAKENADNAMQDSASNFGNGLNIPGLDKFF